MPHSGAADQATESRNDDERKEKAVISPYLSWRRVMSGGRRGWRGVFVSGQNEG